MSFWGAFNQRVSISSDAVSPNHTIIAGKCISINADVASQTGQALVGCSRWAGQANLAAKLISVRADIRAEVLNQTVLGRILQIRLSLAGLLYSKDRFS